MLVVVRNPGESIHIGHDIVVTLVDVGRRRVRVRITADRSIPIDRLDSPAPGLPAPAPPPRDPPQPGRGSLVLLRSAGESFRIGGDIIVTIVTVDRGRARIGVAADERVPVDRSEVYWRKMRELGLVTGEEDNTGDEPGALDDGDAVDADDPHEAAPRRERGPVIWTGSKYEPVRGAPRIITRRRRNVVVAAGQVGALLTRERIS